MTLTDNQVVVIGVGCLLIVIFIIFVPIIPVEGEGSTSLAFCVTQPCIDMVVVEGKETVLDYVRGVSQTQELIRENPDESNDGFACIEIFQPVCGTDGQTYSNECFLSLSENVEIDHVGIC